MIIQVKDILPLYLEGDVHVYNNDVDEIVYIGDYKELPKKYYDYSVIFIQVYDGKLELNIRKNFYLTN